MASRALGVLTLDLVAKIGGFVTGMNQAERVANRKLSDIEKRAKAFGQALGGSLRNAAGNLAGFAAGFVSIQAAITGLKTAIDSADKLNDLNVRLGVSAEALSTWGYAAQQSGTDIDTLGKSLIKLQKAMAAALDPKSTEAKLFAALGVQVTDAEGKLLSLEQVLPQVSDGFKNLTNEALETQAAVTLLGKTGTELDEFINLGSSGLADMAARARELGVELSDKTLKAADDFNDTLGDLKTATQGLFTQLAEALLPELKKLTQQLIIVVNDGRKAGDVADGLTNSFKAVAVVFGEVYNRLDGFGQIISGVTSGFVGLNAAAGALLSGDLGKVRDIFAGSDADAQIGQGAVRLITGASDKIRAETGALAQDIRKQFDAALRPLEKTDKGVDDRVARALSSGGGAAKKDRKTGLNEEQKKAEELKRAYESLNAQLNEQIALFGKDGEAAKVAYETQYGALIGLTQLQKDQLITQAEKLDTMRDEAELAKELQKEHDARVKQAEEVLEGIEAERETLGMSAEQWEIYNNVKRAGANASKETIAAITASTKALQEERKALEPQIQIMDDFRANLEDSIVDVIDGTKSISDAFKDLFDDLAAQITRWIAKRLIEQAFGAPGTTGGGGLGGWIGAGLSALFGGGRAAGGMVMPGQFYRVNETGPEMLSMGGRDYLMMGANAGRITPSANVGRNASFGPTIINVAGSATRETIKQIDRANGRRARRELGRTGP